MSAVRFVVLQGPANLSGDTAAQALQAGDALKISDIFTIAPGFAFTDAGLGAFATAKDFTAVASTDIFTSTAHGFFTGLKVQVSNVGGALPTGLAAMTDYYVIRLDANTFKLSTSFNLAMQGEGVVNITTNGTGTQTATAVDIASGTLKNRTAKLVPPATRLSGKGEWMIGMLSGDETGAVKGAKIKNIQKLISTTHTEGGITYQWYVGTI